MAAPTRVKYLAQPPGWTGLDCIILYFQLIFLLRSNALTKNDEPIKVDFIGSMAFFYSWFAFLLLYYKKWKSVSDWNDIMANKCGKSFANKIENHSKFYCIASIRSWLELWRFCKTIADLLYCMQIKQWKSIILCGCLLIWLHGSFCMLWCFFFIMEYDGLWLR